MFTKIREVRKMWQQLKKWWKWRYIRAKQRKCGVYELQEEQDPKCPEEYMTSSFVAPYSRGSGNVCTLGEKLGSFFTMWQYRKPKQEQIKLPAWEEIEELARKNQHAPPAGNET